MRIIEDPSGDIFVTDTLPFDSFDVQIVVDAIEASLDTIVSEWPLTIEENHGVWTLCFVNPWEQVEYLDFEPLT